jgi:uncharacterized protein (DUF58 family)
MSELSQEVIQKIRHIQMTTTHLADDMMAGAWHSAFKGQGMEFDEVREYQTGDEIRSIDWNVTARMNHPYVKVFGEERELTVLLIVDVSASLRFGGKHQLKRDLIAEVGAVLAFSAIKNNDKIGLVLFSSEIEKYIPPKKGTRHVLRCIRELLAFQPNHKGTDLEKALEFVGSLQSKKAICFLLSDFNCPLPEHSLNVIAKHHDLIAISVRDPYEENLPDLQLAQLEDLETGVQTAIDCGNDHTAEIFRKHSLRQLEDLEKTMHKIRAGIIHLRTDQNYLKPMRKFFKQREVRR